MKKRPHRARRGLKSKLRISAKNNYDSFSEIASPQFRKPRIGLSVLGIIARRHRPITLPKVSFLQRSGDSGDE